MDMVSSSGHHSLTGSFHLTGVHGFIVEQYTTFELLTFELVVGMVQPSRVHESNIT
jgi:hypothetical protein